MVMDAQAARAIVFCHRSLYRI